VPARPIFNIYHAIEQRFPEKRLFLKSDTNTRLIRLRPHTQIFALSALTLLIGWMLVSTSVTLISYIQTDKHGSSQAQSQQSLFEARLSALSQDRDQRLAEATRAQAHFHLALKEVAQMQERLLTSEERRRELATGIDALQVNLRDIRQERDTAKGALRAYQTPSEHDQIRAQDLIATLDVMRHALNNVAQERERIAVDAQESATRANEIQTQKRQLIARNNAIMTRLEEALTISIEPLEKMFRAAGLSPDALIKEIRRSYSGLGGPLTPISPSTNNDALSPQDARARAIISTLDEMNLYRIAAYKTPFATPVAVRHRLTSGYGHRSDPIKGGRRFHAGIDFAAPKGAPILATADGKVTFAGWQSGYGKLVELQHASGIKTRYAHLSTINVKKGEQVSRDTKIGAMGNTGRSTGTHLHYEIHIDGKSVNPMTFIKASKYVF
jgi:murein DD-endopeptidase MepM/ murein hydrolase activator NlpD